MGPLIRLPNWQARLHRYLGAVHGPMQPGLHDCCLFGAGAVLAETGVDLATGWRGRYTTFAGGRRILRRAGYTDHVAMLADHLPEAHVSTAVDGDIAIVPAEDGEAVSVVFGAGVYVLTRAGRIGISPMQPVFRLFKVG